MATKEKHLEAELNSSLAECEQIYRNLENLIHDPSAIDVTELAKEQREIFSGALLYLNDVVESVEELLKQVTLDGAIQNIADRPLRFYREELAPKKAKIEKLLLELLEISVVTIEQNDLRPDSDKTPVWNVLVSGLDFWEADESGVFTVRDIKATNRLVYSPFFRPDEWLKNVDELKPVLGGDAERKIPGSVRVRLKELYQSVILGNYLAAIALARAIMEYALVDKGSRIGICTADSRYPERTKRLYLLVEDTSEKLPELKIDMESVLEAGNQTLHPRKKEKLALLPNYVRKLAFDSVESTRQIVEKLYLGL